MKKIYKNRYYRLSLQYSLVIIISSFSILSYSETNAQLNKKEVFTKADTLRGSLNKNRDWWNVLQYDIEVKPDITQKTIQGKVNIKIQPLSNQETNKYLQIDLQTGLIIDSILWNEKRLNTTKSEGNTWLVEVNNFNTYFGNSLSAKNIEIIYHGKPIEAINPPWDGGWIWSKDQNGNPFVSVACQGLGASSWYPCKDYQGDEPENGATLTITVPDSLVAVGNGKKILTSHDGNFTSYIWQVNNPINNYNIVPYIGKYVNFKDTLQGEGGKLNLDFWVLNYNVEKAKEQFKQAKIMLHCFEHWFGKYPFYSDGYKLVEAPHLGMEHQSAIAYGNGFTNGYKGRDLSGSGWGLKWDFIIIHESGHEWFANNITTNDIADMWVHEGFTNFSETLYTEWLYGVDAGLDYNVGIRKNIRNDKPIIGPYGVNKEGSSDMYYKAANMIQNIRHSIDNDEKFRQILRGLNTTFYHTTVDTKQIEDYIINHSGTDFKPTFNQYLRTTEIPQLNFFKDSSNYTIHLKWSNCIDNFLMPLTIPLTHKKLNPSIVWQTLELTKAEYDCFTKENLKRYYYIKTNELTIKP